MTWLEKRPWIAVAILSAIAFAFRTIPQYYSVFQGEFVNFQETDAWYHVRVVENLVHHFPLRISIDPYMGVGPVQDVATGPFYDWLLGGAAWLAGLGHPSSGLVHVLAAWYPAVLGACIVPVVFLLGELIFGVRAGLFATAVIATLPGHFLTVSSLGFTDHHVMESLLSAGFLLALLRALEKPASIGRAVLAGLVLAAYLLTFVGGAFFVAIVVLWAAYDLIRSQWPRPEPGIAGRPLYISFLVAAALIAPWYRLLWMPYSIATLVAGAGAVFLLARWSAFCERLPQRRMVFFGGLGAAAAVSVFALFMLPGVVSALHAVAPFFMPAYFGTTGAVRELQALVFPRGGFTLLPAWRQFAGAYVLSVVALLLLAELAVKRPQKGASLLFFWGSITFLLAMGQVRMTYYFAVAAALLSGYLVARISESDASVWVQWAGAAVLVLAIFVPNVAAAIEMGQEPRGVGQDWRQALEWINKSTPEPFGDPAFYFANYGQDFKHPPQAYSIMAWWDYGYWLEAIARRIPVTNPTQSNASLAASFFLAQSEEEALRILDQARSKYVAVNAELPLLLDSDGAIRGSYPDFFVWDKTKKLDDYFLIVLEPVGDGRVRFRLLYRPAYYRSMAARLFVYGAEGVANPQTSIAYIERLQSWAGKSYPVLARLRTFASAGEAAAAERECRAEGCLIAGENPQVSCVALERLIQFHQVFGSDSPVLGAGPTRRSAVQIYEIQSSRSSFQNGVTTH